jgi:hypothetical protein
MLTKRRKLKSVDKTGGTKQGDRMLIRISAMLNFESW